MVKFHAFAQKPAVGRFATNLVHG